MKLEQNRWWRKTPLLDKFHKSHNTPVPYPIIHHWEQKCAKFCFERCIVGYGACALWDSPDNKDHGANMGPTWVLSASGRSHVGPMNLAIREVYFRKYAYLARLELFHRIRNLPECTTGKNKQQLTTRPPLSKYNQYQNILCASKWNPLVSPQCIYVLNHNIHIFIMGIPILVWRHLYIETAPFSRRLFTKYFNSNIYPNNLLATNVLKQYNCFVFTILTLTVDIFEASRHSHNADIWKTMGIPTTSCITTLP